MSATEIRVIDGETVRRLAAPRDLIAAMRAAGAGARFGRVWFGNGHALKTWALDAGRQKAANAA